MDKKPKWHKDKSLIKVKVTVEGCCCDQNQAPRIVFKLGPVSNRELVTKATERKEIR